MVEDLLRSQNIRRIDMKTTEATLYITLEVGCPECEHDFDLLADTTLNDEGGLLHQTIEDDRWKIPSEERLQCEPECPRCNKRFKVKGVIW